MTKNKVDEERIVNDDAFTTFYAAEYTYRVTRSKYGDRVASTTTREAKNARNLTTSVDVTKKNTLIQDITNLRARQAELEAKLEKLVDEQKDIRGQDEPIRRERVRSFSFFLSFFLFFSLFLFFFGGGF